jgi:hypothetical protein
MKKNVKNKKTALATSCQLKFSDPSAFLTENNA